MLPDKMIEEIERRIAKYKEVKHYLEAMEAIQTQLVGGERTTHWEMTEVDGKTGDRIMSRELPGALFESIVGAGLRVMIPVLRERTETFNPLID